MAKPLEHTESQGGVSHRFIDRWSGPEGGEPWQALLRRRLRAPEGLFIARWSASDRDREAFDLNEIFPLSAAWAVVDPPVARDLLRSAFAVQADDGSLPRLVTPDGRVLDEAAPWPLFCQAALAANLRDSSEGFREEMRHRLAAYLQWAFRYYDPAMSGRPKWPRAADSLAPDTWDAPLCSGELAAWLIAEADALFRFQPESDLWQDLRQHAILLEENLLSFFWDEKTGTFRSRYSDGRFVSRLTWSAILPLCWRHLPAARVAAAEAFLADGSPLIGPDGVRLWEPWPDDPIPPPAPPLQQAALLAGLRLAGRRHLARRISHQLLAARGSADAAADRAVPERLPATSTREVSIGSAALHCLAQDQQPEAATGGELFVGSPPMKTRAVWIMGAAMLLVLGLTLVVASWWLRPRPPPGPSLEAIIGLAQNHYRRGEFEEAERICHDVARAWGERTALSVRFLYGNVLFRLQRYTEAAEQYRLALKDPNIEPLARFNLAQTLIRGNRLAEARREFLSLVEEFHDEFPEIAEHAQLTADFLRDKLAEQSAILPALPAPPLGP